MLSEPTVYLNGHFMLKSAAVISPDDRGFLFGDGVYEVVRSYRGVLFGWDQHLARLGRSLEATGIAAPAGDDLRQVALRLLEMNGLNEDPATVYLQVTRGVAPRRHAFPRPAVPPTVFGAAKIFSEPRVAWRDGAAAILVPDDRWQRCEIKSTALQANVMAAEKAAAAEVYEALFVRDKMILEGSHSSFAAVRDGELWTAPLECPILPGVTRALVLELARELAIPVRQTPVPVSAVSCLDEAMLLGTTTEVMPVVRIDDTLVGTGEVGPITRRLQEAFTGLTAAAVADGG